MRTLFFIAVCMFACGASAATNYVRADAAGDATGADWANAYTNLPATLTRGNTYYVADGSYGVRTFDDAESGDALITVKKATVSDHGTATGWSDDYGDGSAFWSRWFVETGDYLFDGQVGQWATNWPGFVDYGFKVEMAQAGTSLKLIQIGVSGSRPSNIDLKHIAVRFTNDGTGSGWAPGGDSLYIYGGDDLSFQYLWIHNTARVCFYHISGSNLTLEYSFLEENGQAQIAESWGDVEHSQVLNWGGGTNSIYRYNVLRRYYSTGGLTVLPAATDSQIYGSIFTQDAPTAGTRVVGGFNAELPMTNIVIFNNTFVNITNGGTITSGDWTNSTLRNNIFFNVKNGSAISFTTHLTRSHNWYYDVGADMSSETDVEIGDGSPFADLAGTNYTLSAATLAGYTNGLVAIDPAGATRGADGVWDRGAYEFSGESPSPPVSGQGRANAGRLRATLLRWRE